MNYIIGLLLALTTFSAHAQDSSELAVPTDAAVSPVVSTLSRSEFFYLPGRHRSTTEISFTSMSNSIAAQSLRNGETGLLKQTAEAYAFHYIYGFNDSLHLVIDAGFLNSKGTFADQNYKTSGLTDFGLTLLKRKTYANWNLIYGAKATLSPEDAKQASADSVGSNFSGAQGLAPFIGAEVGASGGNVFGLKFSLPFQILPASGGTSSDLNYARSRNVHVDGTAFYEYPLYRQADLGLALSFTENDFRLAAGSRDYTARAYTTIHLAEDAAVRLAVEGTSSAGPTVGQNSTQLSAAFRRTL
jgi:hypothetical protein